MDEPADRGRLAGLAIEERKFVTNAAAAELGYAQEGINAAGEGERAEELAVRFGAKADRFAVMNVEPAFGDQHLVDNGVEVAVVVGVIDVAVDVVVLPARLKDRFVRVGGLVGRRVLWLSAHGELKLPAEHSVAAGARAKNNGAPASCRDAVSFNGTAVRAPRRRPCTTRP